MREREKEREKEKERERITIEMNWLYSVEGHECQKNTSSGLKLSKLSYSNKQRKKQRKMNYQLF